MIAKTWNCPTCLSPAKWINNNGITTSTKNSFLSFVAKWLKMEDVSVMKLARPREANAVCSFPFVETRRSRLEGRKMVTGPWKGGQWSRRDGWVWSVLFYICMRPLACWIKSWIPHNIKTCGLKHPSSQNPQNFRSNRYFSYDVTFSS